MSTSTLSATANPTSAAVATAAERRRSVLVYEKRTARDLSGSDGNAAATPVSKEKVTVPETVKKPITADSTTQRKKRKKPRWQTVLSVLTKNFILLLILVVLVRMIQRLAIRNDHVYSSGFDREVAEMEALVKKTTKMLQVQVEVVDRKIEKEIMGLRNELGERIDVNSGKLGTHLGDLDRRVESVERSVTSGKWLGKDDFDKFLEEFKKGKGNGLDGDVKLDEVRALAREIIEKELENHAADGLGRVDYAVESGGGMVVKHSEAYSRTFMYTHGVHVAAVKILQPSFGEPGQCFALKGNNGFVQIRLRTAIIPEAITLEHVAKSVAFDRSSAPKDCRVFGWLQSQEKRNSQVDAEKMLLLREFSYDLEKSYAQTFNVLEMASPVAVDTIRLDFTSNHGNPNLTCIYRLRVHGHEPNTW